MDGRPFGLKTKAEEGKETEEGANRVGKKTKFDRCQTDQISFVFVGSHFTWGREVRCLAPSEEARENKERERVSEAKKESAQAKEREK